MFSMRMFTLLCVPQVPIGGSGEEGSGFDDGSGMEPELTVGSGSGSGSEARSEGLALSVDLFALKTAPR
ncbi:unnamed protein product [Strongylus vulgaris]|uniref:Uncharacterized protein n=1 Tax=Strongylus vulgaris TaxID=40348 RepID=A0A3P7J5J1_STRVU|nr:unnamed protein product [Strongylus vulgaris]